MIIFYFKISNFVFTTFFALVVLAHPTLSYADWEGHHHDGWHHNGWRHDNDERHSYRYHDEPRFGFYLSFLPHGCFNFSIGGLRYYYSDGFYYNRRVVGDYVLVNPPVGAMIRTIPQDYYPVVINGATYYTNNGIYYLYTPQGYQVVSQPVTTVVQSPQPTQTITTTNYGNANGNADSDDSVMVNIPNNKNGYTPVIIKKTPQGFVGPQGEFYAEFPKVSQLKLIYGK